MPKSKRRKRKIPDSVDMTPDRSSPLKRIRNHSLDISEDDGSDTGTIESGDDAEDLLRNYTRETKSIARIVRSRYRGDQGQYLRREMGVSGGVIERRCLSRDLRVSDEWQQETANFSTRPEDAYNCMNVATPSENTIPFCTASCNSKLRVLLFV